MLDEIFRLVKHTKQKAMDFHILQRIESRESSLGADDLVELLPILSQSFSVELTCQHMLPSAPVEALIKTVSL